jgi:hypothetical protein
VICPDCAALRAEVGPEKAAEILAAALVVVRTLRHEPAATGQGQVRVVMQRNEVVKVYRLVEHEHRGPAT